MIAPVDRRPIMLAPGFSFAALVLLAAAGPAGAIGPEDVYLLVNQNVPQSRAIAEHYCRKRGVPTDHILAFDLPAGEDISRAAYESKLAQPLRARIQDRRDSVKVLLSIYGVPLRVGPQEPTAEDRAELDKLRPQLEALEKKKAALHADITALEAKVRQEPKDAAAKDVPARKKEYHDIEGQIRPLEERRRWLSYSESLAAVDSELALLWHSGYDLRRWQLNLLHFQVPASLRKGKPPVIMTARLDGPSPELVKQIIDQSLAVEAKGLTGKVYVDARGIKYTPGDGGGFGYGGYDESLREMARLLEREGKMSVTLDDKPELFPPGSCPECALYCGWYSHAIYVDCCRFVPGAVAFHIASSEAVSLRNPGVKYWCKNLLEHGVVATLGPVSEPYTIGFPKPAEFFGFLATGEFTLVECYWRTSLFASWMTVLVGDPLYKPFAKNPRLKSDQVKPSPRGGSMRIIQEAK
jgi:uncharacterized protein (TIGR03790 family)